MLAELVKELGDDLKMQDFIKNPKDNHYQITFKNNTVVALLSNSDCFFLKGAIGTIPKDKADAYLTKIMDANLFGKGAHGGVLGMENDGQELCLIFTLPNSTNYKLFKEKLTQFVNSISAWRKILENPLKASAAKR